MDSMIETESGLLTERSPPLPDSAIDELPTEMPIEGQQRTHELKANLTVLSTTYYQPPNEQPISDERRYSKWLLTDEQPYQRKLKVGPKWTRLDTGWLTECSLVSITNLEGKFTQRIPTQEERDAASARIVEIAFLPPSEYCPDKELLIRHGPSILIPSGEERNFTPVRLTSVYVRCEAGEAKCSLIVYPK